MSHVQNVLLNRVRGLVESGYTWAAACDFVSNQLAEEGLPTSAEYIANQRNRPQLIKET